MLDFFTIATSSTKRGLIEIYPKFLIKNSSDLMIRGGDFYAIWDADSGLWSTDEQTAFQLIDKELDCYVKEHKNQFDGNVRVLHMWDADSGMVDKWHKYCQKQLRDSFHMLDEKLIFSNTETNKKDYASKRLGYPLEEGDCSAYKKLISTLYSEEEREKIEWSIGSIVSGDSKKIQKFMVLYGSSGTGKSTVLNIIQQLFEGYYSVFDAKALGSTSNSFALEAFKTNPLVAIQHDGDLSRIEDNTRLNSLVSHELMTVNEKFKSSYANRFKCFLFMGTNKPVKITDAKSGLIRRLIDVSPSGNKVDFEEYKVLMNKISFELGHIAYHCKKVYLENPNRYDEYIPVRMFGASNDFYNFIIDSYHVFKKENGTTLKSAWTMYKSYCEDANVSFPFSQRIFKEELKNYFDNYRERFSLEDGTRVRSYYEGFKTAQFENQVLPKKKEEPKLLKLEETTSVLDAEYGDCFAQYATSKETPIKKWEHVTSKLSDLDTKRLHYVKIPQNHIVIDFDIPDENGNKSLEKNIEEASKFPETYAELSKSGKGVHLHYIYTGDVEQLSRVYDEHIEIKVFNGNASLRRKLTKCNDVPINTISSGLPLKGERKMVNLETVKSEKGLRMLISRNLNKDIHPGTKPSIDFIFKILEDAYNNGLKYDVTDMRNAILAFGAGSTHHADYCIKLINKMKFKSDEPSMNIANNDSKLVFYDVEVFPNLFLINWKIEGEGKTIVRMINPTPAEVEELMGFRLVGFNCRRYDNHILYARLMGYTNEELYRLSQRIIKNSQNCFFAEAYNISYTDIYDFSAKKQSLKKWEIELGIHHQELGLPWDQPVPEDMWIKVAEYCDNDVIATEAVFNHLKGDFVARQILADLAGGTVNDTTNSLTTKIIFGNNRKPQSQFNYRNLAEPVFDMDEETYEFLSEIAPEMMSKTHGGEGSLLPYFPGYKYENGKSIYLGEEVGEGGYAYSEPGMYGNAALLDVTSEHPHSAMMEVIFGVQFTRRFYELVYGRVYIKHEDWNKINSILDNKLAPYVEKVKNGELTSKDLANALKIAINSVYGLTAANFDNPFRDIHNKDNIVAKRGALFMINLKHEVQKRGFIVAHIKTDSIKIPDATPEIIQFVMDYGKEYGYTFEHEATYDRMCLVNDAVYIAKYASTEKCEELYGYVPGDNKKHPGEWTATGTQFAVPYVFKKLFSKEEIVFEDMCETKSVTTALYLDMNENLSDVTEEEKELDSRLYNERVGTGKVLKRLNPKFENVSNEDLEKIISDGHNYIFIGRVGSFCPIKPNSGGGNLVRKGTDRQGNVHYYNATGAKGYRWLESEYVKEVGAEGLIDKVYYDDLVTDAVQTIVVYGDYEWFVSDDPYIEPPYKDGKPVYLDGQQIN